MFKFFSVLLFFTIIAACGLKYTPVESPQAYEVRRHDTIEAYLGRTFANSNYQSIAFGESQTIKPVSYTKLDSLFAVKYANEKKGNHSKELDHKIELQRMISLNDTNKVVFIENHVFSIGTGDTLEIYDGNFNLTSDFRILDVNLNESVYLSKKYDEIYKVYLFEEAFVALGNSASTAEKNFYTIYKEYAASLTGKRRDAFIQHTLNLMIYANKVNTLDTEALLQYAIIKQVHGNSYINHLDKFSALEERFSLNDKNEEVFIGYQLSCTFAETTTNSIQVMKSYLFIFDEYLQFIEKRELN